jgi:hypothetical protein
MKKVSIFKLCILEKNLLLKYMDAYVTYILILEFTEISIPINIDMIQKLNDANNDHVLVLLFEQIFKKNETDTLSTLRAPGPTIDS